MKRWTWEIKVGGGMGWRELKPDELLGQGFVFVLDAEAEIEKARADEGEQITEQLLEAARTWHGFNRIEGIIGLDVAVNIVRSRGEKKPCDHSRKKIRYVMPSKFRYGLLHGEVSCVICGEKLATEARLEITKSGATQWITPFPTTGVVDAYIEIPDNEFKAAKIGSWKEPLNGPGHVYKITVENAGSDWLFSTYDVACKVNELIDALKAKGVL